MAKVMQRVPVESELFYYSHQIWASVPKNQDCIVLVGDPIHLRLCEQKLGFSQSERIEEFNINGARTRVHDTR
eukprot:scaffold6679_cov144-Amphora_coffeaeformis.AAC.12